MIPITSSADVHSERIVMDRRTAGLNREANGIQNHPADAGDKSCVRTNQSVVYPGKPQDKIGRQDKGKNQPQEF
jgi:hypothetical protein